MKTLKIPSQILLVALSSLTTFLGGCGGMGHNAQQPTYPVGSYPGIYPPGYPSTYSTPGIPGVAPPSGFPPVYGTPMTTPPGTVGAPSLPAPGVPAANYPPQTMPQPTVPLTGYPYGTVMPPQQATLPNGYMNNNTPILFGR